MVSAHRRWSVLSRKGLNSSLERLRQGTCPPARSHTVVPNPVWHRIPVISLWGWLPLHADYALRRIVLHWICQDLESVGRAVSIVCSHLYWQSQTTTWHQTQQMGNTYKRRTNERLREGWVVFLEHLWKQHDMRSYRRYSDSCLTCSSFNMPAPIFVVCAMLIAIVLQDLYHASGSCRSVKTNLQSGYFSLSWS